MKKNENGDYLLMFAIANDNLEIVRLLIDYESKINAKLEINEKNKDGEYPLLLTSCKDSIELIKLLIGYKNKKSYCLGK
ncbi:hypothetical protein U3516DRAFT_885862 [Neocallimastix sp. 'constans']|jgi:ankyrin repeat protein